MKTRYRNKNFSTFINISLKKKIIDYKKYSYYKNRVYRKIEKR